MTTALLPRPFASLVILGAGGQPDPSKPELPLRELRFSVGRDDDNHLSLSHDSAVSRHHCAIEVVGAALVLKDLHSANGTWLDGHRVQDVEALSPPCWLTVGQTRLAVVPVQSSATVLDHLQDSTYSTRGNIVIPPRSAFVQRTEAFLVVDIVGSTRLVHDSDLLLPRLLRTLGRTLEKALQLEEEPFLKCTGDGFLACFGTARAAWDAALQLRPALVPHISRPLQLSIALHWGSASLAANGDRISKDVHAVFALEHLRHEAPEVAKCLANRDVDQIVLMTERFWSQLEPTHCGQAEPVGSYLLKGLEQPQPVFRWIGPTVK